MRRVLRLALLGLLLAFGLGFTGAEANPILQQFHGHPVAAGGGGGTVFAGDCVNAPGICADHVAGQTFLQWFDSATGAPGAAFRYRVYRSTAPLTSGNYAAATLDASYIFNNSGQLFGGNPDVVGGSTFTQAHRQANDANNPMAKIPDAQAGGGALKTLAYGTGLQVHTAQITGTAYYAVVQTNTSDTSPVFLGSVGPIAETVATPQAIRYAHRTTGYGTITSSTAGLPIVFTAHASSGSGGAATNSNVADYYEWFGDLTQGYQDGRATAFDLARDGVGGSNYPSLTGGALVFGNRDTVWYPDGGASVSSTTPAAIETDHFGLGLTPNAQVGVANRFYSTTANTIQQQIEWIVNSTGGDRNRVSMTGSSMGAIGGAIDGAHLTSLADPTKPLFASVWMGHPLFRLDLYGSTAWCGVGWTAAQPFKPTLGAAPSVCGTNSAAVLRSDGSSWFNYIDVASVYAASPGTDLAFVGGFTTKDDGNLTASTGPGLQPAGSFLQIITALNALQNAHRGHAFVFYEGEHTATSDAGGAVNCDSSSGADAIAGVCYSKLLFSTILPYVATDHSSLDDNFGTATRDANGLYDGDAIGCINCGFVWGGFSDTAGGVSFTLRNTWMTRAATVLPQTTLSAPIASTSSTSAISVVDASGFLTGIASSHNAYAVIDPGGANEEAISLVSFTSSTVTPAARGKLGTTGRTHSAGEVIRQYTSKPTGPNIGPQTSMTTNATPRRLQNFKPADGTVLACTITPFGESPSVQNVTVTNGLITILGSSGTPMKINSGGVTTVACS